MSVLFLPKVGEVGLEPTTSRTRTRLLFLLLRASHSPEFCLPCCLRFYKPWCSRLFKPWGVRLPISKVLYWKDYILSIFIGQGSFPPIYG